MIFYNEFSIQYFENRTRDNRDFFPLDPPAEDNIILRVNNITYEQIILYPITSLRWLPYAQTRAAIVKDRRRALRVYVLFVLSSSRLL